MPISRSRRMRLIAVAAATIVAVVVAIVAISASQSGGAAAGTLAGTVAVPGYPAGTVFTASDASGKRALITRALQAEPAAVVKQGAISTLNHNEWLYADGQKAIAPAGGKANAIMVSGRTFAQVPFWDLKKNHATYSETSSLVAWLGAAPVNADTITQTDNWTTSTYGGSSPKVTGTPQGATLAGPGILVFKSQVSHGWISMHHWSGSVSVTTTGVVYQVGYQLTGTFQFGSSFFTVSGQDAAGV